ncbi:MAG: Rpn family recombination-promoting nuclease/putative transposase, partial [Eubacteriales bacterium]|nr:Rpn family recombination-promoting nuclease/putative transposase [Eubacteriales bacterium]
DGFRTPAEGGTMGKKEEPMLKYYDESRHFAGLLNGWLYHGENRIQPEQISPWNARYTGKSGRGRKGSYRSRYRDIVKKVDGYRVLLIMGTEIQTYVDYSMPVRIMDYDALEYASQIAGLRGCRKQSRGQNLSQSQDMGSSPCQNQGQNQSVVSAPNQSQGMGSSRGQSPDQGGGELSALQKSDRLTPVLTLVLYIGEEPWDAAGSLHELLDFSGVPVELRKYIPDYPIHVLDVCHTEDSRLLEFPGDIACMFLVLKYRKDKETLERLIHEVAAFRKVEEETYDTLWNFIDSARMQEWKENIEKKEGGIDMCLAIEEMYMDGKREGEEKGRINGTAQDIFDLLEDLGAIPTQIRDGVEKLAKEMNLERLRALLKVAARCGSFEEFERQL